ncbi:MAG TPA: polysaccharide biosynthesis protein [Solirubrobacteraceae bacterium]|nr:polysaccharide biosynthesis protein [Solirubrobacteraceae bacterium]
MENYENDESNGFRPGDEGPDIATVALSDAEVAAAAHDRQTALARLQSLLEIGTQGEIAAARVELAFHALDVADKDSAIELLREADKFAYAQTGKDIADLLLEIAAGWREVDHVMCARRLYQRVVDLLTVVREGDGRRGRSVAVPRDPRERFLLAFASFQLGTLASSLKRDDRPYFTAAHEQGDDNVAPFAALMLARKEEGTGGRPAKQERLLWEARGYGHPIASPQAAFELARMLAARGQREVSLKLLVEVRDRGGQEPLRLRAEKGIAELSQTEDATTWSDAPVAAAPPASPFEEPGQRKVIIVGAGRGGQYLYDSLWRVPALRHRYDVLGFVDDFHYDAVPGTGKPVLGGLDDLAKTLVVKQPHAVWMAMPTVSPARKKVVAQACAAAGVPLKTLPVSHELVTENSLTAQLRDVRPDDVLGDHPIELDPTAAEWLRARRLLIVGCGTIGLEVARRAADAGAEWITVVDRNDQSLTRFENEMLAREYRRTSRHHGSSVDGRLIVQLAADEGCDAIVYAASGWMTAGHQRTRRDRVLRGMSELVRGLSTLERLERFVWVSHSGVALPTTPERGLEAIAEAFVMRSGSEDDSYTRCAVRVPSVYTSGESIIATLEQQASLGTPLRIPTHPSMFRFIHSYRAAELVLRAADLATTRETLAVTAGEQVSLRHLAELILELRGQEAGEDLHIEEVEDLMVGDTPLPAGAPTGVEGLVTLGVSPEDPTLAGQVKALVGRNADAAVALARQLYEAAARQDVPATL